MRKITLLFLFVLQTGFAGDSIRFINLTPQQIDSIITVISQSSMTVTEKMKYYSKLFLETPYSFTCVGDGENALYEPYPLVNFKETNCMAFCEHVLALSISDSWDNFFNNLQQIRYKDGQIGMRTRNHYTMVDWLPENDWLLIPVTAEVGEKWTKQVTRTISHTKFFTGKAIHDMRHVIPDRQITIDYIPKEHLDKIGGKIQSGDIGSLIFANKEDIFSAHMFMIYQESEGWIVRESSNSRMSTFDSPLNEWINKIKTSERYIGISLMRVRPELDTPRRIIFPEHVIELKKR